MAGAKAAYSLQQKKAVLNKVSIKREQFFMSTFSSLSVVNFLILSKKYYFIAIKLIHKKKKKEKNVSWERFSILSHAISIS